MMDNAGVHTLCNAIMLQAAIDYRRLRKGGKIPGETLMSVTMFFHSDWAQLLCRKADPIVIFQKLQGEFEL